MTHAEISELPAATLVGFTLENGRVDGSSLSLYSLGTFGGGVQGGIVKNCVIRNCDAIQYGGGATFSYLESCVISNCAANILGGGGWNCAFDNCLIIGNSIAFIPGDGAGCSCSYVVNSTVSKNFITLRTHSYAEDEDFSDFAEAKGHMPAEEVALCGEMVGVATDCGCYNSIVWHNYYAETNAQVCVYEEELSCVTNFYCRDGIQNSFTPAHPTDPQFNAPEHGDFRLKPISPCIDSGSNTYAKSGYDLAGNTRVYGNSVDLGAYEFVPCGDFVSTVEFVIREGVRRTGGGELVQLVTNRLAATAPELSVDDGYMFFGWDRDFSFILSNLTVTARVQHLADGVKVFPPKVTGDTVLEKGAVYVVTGEVRVVSGVKLTIPETTVIKFFGGASMIVEKEASCVAGGVTFTHVADDTVGGDTLLDGDGIKPSWYEYRIEGGIVGNENTEYRYTFARYVKIENVTCHQRYPWNGKVDIDFDVSCNDTLTNIMLRVSAMDSSRPLAVETISVAGDVAAVNGNVSVRAGRHRIVWDAGSDNPDVASTNVVVAIQGTLCERLYLVVDLSGGASAVKYPCRYSEIGPDLTDDACRTTNLWLRRIPSGTFGMGSPAGALGRKACETLHEVTLTDSYYMGVFELTQSQWQQILGGSQNGVLPKNDVKFSTVRGNNRGAGWPNHNDVDESSLLGKLRARTSLMFDLPTEAQWEYACRAGTDTDLNSGFDLNNAEHDDELDRLGRYYYNGNTPVRVGSYLPNAWGLYDMHGNVLEWCLDWADVNNSVVVDYASGPQTNPVGRATGASRALRGGCYSSYAKGCSSAYRGCHVPGLYNADNVNYGLRLCCPVSVEDDSFFMDIECSRSPCFPLFTVGLGRTMLLNSPTAEIRYSTQWNGLDAGKAVVKMDGEILSSADGEGEVALDVSAVSAGLHVLTHECQGETLSAKFAVLDHDAVEHAGTVQGEWSADVVHVVRSSVVVPAGMTLTIAPGAIVKFMPGAELVLEDDGTCVARGVIFTHIADDTAGGDTLFDGRESQPGYDEYSVDRTISDDETTEYRYLTPTSVTLSGTLKKSETWKGYKVYHVTGDLTIPSGVTLSVEPGAVVKFDVGKSLTISSGGKLNAQGTRAQPIIFTSIKDDEHGGDTNGDGDATTAAAGDWSKIATVSGGTANMTHVHILYASKNSTTGAINMNGGMVTFDYGIIAHCAYDAVGVESGNISMSNSIVYDCLLFGRHYTKGPFVNCVFYDCGRITQGGSNHVFVNCIFSKITELWEAFGFPQSTTYKNCCFWNEGGSILVREGYTEDARDVCGKNGNIWADPLFVDAANGDFRLQEGSPCIDAGNGSYAPTTDYYGQTRQTVDAATATGTKAANGNYPDIGIYEVMPGPVPSDVDLTVTAVTAPAEFTVGEKVSISWTVKNIGTAYATGSWRDKVEIICANGTAIEMGEKTVTATLAPGAEKSFTAMWTVPSAQAGTVHVRVTANAERDIFEGTLGANNAYTLETDIALALQECPIPSDGHAGRVTVPAGGSVAYALGADFAAGGLLVVKSAKSVTVRTGNGQLPTADTYHAAAVQIADGQWLVSVPEDGKAYVEIENDTSDAASVEVSYKEGAFAFYDTGATVTFTKDCGSDLVLTAYGNGFSGDMSVALVGSGNVIESSDVTVSCSGTRVSITFADSDCVAGEYHLCFTKNGQTLVQDGNPITIQNRATGAADILGKMEYSLEMTETVRQGREYMGYIVYGNVADKGICAAPYLRVTASNGSYVRFSQSDAWSSQLELMGISQSYPASQVKAGESIKVPFYYKTTSSSADIKLGAASSADGDFPWETNGRYMRPSWASDEFWGLAFAILKANIGTSWGDWIARMRHNADYLMKLGKATYRLEPLWQLDVNEALGVDHAVSSLAGGTDLARSGRGLGLALRRSYGAAFYSRFKSGVFGYGWSDNYSAWAELQDSGSTLALHSGSGSTYRFYKVNGAWTPEDARDKTKVTESSSEYVLTYRSGTVQRIAKSNMRVASITDNQGNAITFTYATVGSAPRADRLTRVSHTDGQSLSFTYENGKLVSAMDDQGRTARYGYDGDLLTSVTAFNGLVTRYAYYPADGTPTSRALRQITYPDGNTKDFTYDAAGRVATAAVNGNLMLTEIVRGEFGSYKTIAPNSGVSSVSVGVSGEVLETVNALGQKVTRTYTDDTLLESLIGPTGKRSKIAYDADGNAVKATDAAGTQTSFAYTSDYGALAKVTDARGNALNYGYDKLGRSEQISYADDSSERIEYSARGDIVKSVNRRGQSVEYAYDAEGNVLSETWETGRVLTWLYDDRGNCTNACDSETGAVTMEYDANERLTRIAYPNGHGFTYAYNALGRTTARTSFDGFAQKYEYDALGRLKKLTDGDGKPYLENVYDETTGQLWLMKYGNGTIVSNAYDILGRTVGIYHYVPGDGGRGATALPNDSSDTVGSAPRADRLAAFFEYAYDAEGRRISQTTAEGVERYTYDTVGQLTDVSYPDGTEEHFRYDAVGNRLTANGDTYEVNNLNQYTKISTSTSTSTSFTYDADGNMTSKTHPTDGTTSYTYDIQNRLVAVTNETRDILWACVYDVFGNRVKVIDHGTATEKVFAQGSLPSVVEEYAGGTRTQRHVLSGAVRLADIATDGAMSYYHTDSLGSLRLATDATGATTATASYKAFGAERTVGSAPHADRPAGWVGAYGVDYDAATGLYFMRRRYYDKENGRFLQRDPVGLAANDVNSYRYCNNSVLNTIDPSGCASISAICRILKIFGYGRNGGKDRCGHGFHEVRDSNDPRGYRCEPDDPNQGLKVAPAPPLTEEQGKNIDIQAYSQPNEEVSNTHTYHPVDYVKENFHPVDWMCDHPYLTTAGVITVGVILLPEEATAAVIGGVGYMGMMLFGQLAPVIP